MSDTTVHSSNQVQQWDSDFFMEYVRDSQFKAETGADENNVIQVKENLTKQAGDKITVSFIRALQGSGVTGSTTLEGNEEALVNYGHQITVNALRHAVAVDKMNEIRTAIDMRNAARNALKFWAMDKMRDGIIAALYSPHVSGNVAYASATEAQKDAWLTANSDRVLFGAAKSNSSSLDHSTSLGNVDNTSDKLVGSVVSLAKRMAKTASPAIKPIRIDGGKEWFILYAGSQAFRDFKNDSSVQQANRDAWTRGDSNPLFQDGDLLWDGVIVKEVPEISVISGAGNGGIDVAPAFLCGAQAVGLAWAQRTRTATDVRDYGFKFGVAIEEIRGIEKLMSNSVQNGLVTIYTAAVADT